MIIFRNNIVLLTKDFRNESRNKALTLAVILFFLLLNSAVLAKSSFSPERIRKACLDYIYDRAGNDAQVIISSKIDNLEFMENNVAAEIIETKNPLRGNCFIVIEFRDEERLLKRLEVPVRIRLFMDVPVAVNPIRRGTAITDSDFEISKKEITYYNESEILTTEQITGKTAKNNIMKGYIITTGLLEHNDMIHRGEKVVIVIQSGAVRIRATGISLQDAAPGENIRVKRDGSQSVLTGKAGNDKSVILSLN